MDEEDRMEDEHQGFPTAPSASKRSAESFSRRNHRREGGDLTNRGMMICKIARSCRMKSLFTPSLDDAVKGGKLLTCAAKVLSGIVLILTC